MKKCMVVNKYKESYDVYIGRGSLYGNKWSHEEGTKARYMVSTREEAIEKYKEWFYEQVSDVWFLKQVLKLRGKRLGCVCSPKPCHGNIIAEFVNNYNYEV